MFDVQIDGRILYSKKLTGRHARPGEVLERFRAELGSDVRQFDR